MSPKSIEAMARGMAHMLRKVQPRGPYWIVGYSWRILAYAIAHYSSASTKSLPLGLIDCHLPYDTPGRPLDVKHMLLAYMLSVRPRNGTVG